MKKNIFRVSALLGVLATLAAVERLEGQSGADRTQACLSQSTDSFVACVDEHAWYVAPLCELKFAADLLLCAPSIVFKSSEGDS